MAAIVDPYEKSRAYYARSRMSLARGVASAMKVTQEPVPICATRGEGSRIWDLDGREYLDFTLSYGPLLLGQSPAPVLDAVRQQLTKGIGYGANHEREAELAELVCATVPSAERTVFSSTGSEAVQAALRIARAATGRNRVIKFVGHYHGWMDSIHVAIPGLPGTGAGTAGQDPMAANAVTVCPWNDAEALRDVLADDVAAVIMEPININGGGFSPVSGYVETVRDLTHKMGAILIFDEVITGYRVALGGAQQLLGVEPDLTILGKAIGGGFPVSAVCGRADVMECVAAGRVAHMGNFNANPVAASAAVATIRHLVTREAEIYLGLEANIQRLGSALTEEASAAGLPMQINCQVGAGFAFISPTPVLSHDDRLKTDPVAYGRFAYHLLNHGVHAPSRGLWYVSTAHTAADIDQAREAMAEAALATAAEVVAISTADQR